MMYSRKSSARPLNQRGSPWKKLFQIFSQLAIETAEKNHVEEGYGLTWNLYGPSLAYQIAPSWGIQTPSQNPPCFKWFPQPFQELAG
jgi:hypothetical protein